MEDEKIVSRVRFANAFNTLFCVEIAYHRGVDHLLEGKCGILSRLKRDGPLRGMDLKIDDQVPTVENAARSYSTEAHHFLARKWSIGTQKKHVPTAQKKMNIGESVELDPVVRADSVSKREILWAPNSVYSCY